MVTLFRRSAPRPRSRSASGSATIAKHRLRAVLRTPQRRRGDDSTLLLVRLLHEDVAAPGKRRAS
ncbi:hypothetical protein [Candidatus Oscillochloris fontis]|uniref:hypothetical protein n=1 Tax=Candidatus Oscillochloris fontis TaxID=2496868 RepID=UPI00101D0DC0|nr:hypothetical protein [Candidatus Oscillochloris fontis]